MTQAGGLKNGPGLHGGDLGVDDPQPAAAVAQHGVHFFQLFHPADDGFLRDAEAFGELIGQAGLLVQVVFGEELVQRRVEQADRDRAALHLAEQAGKVVPLEGEQFGQGFFAGFPRLGHDHLADFVEVLEEHVLGAAQADPLGTEGDGGGRLVGLVGVRADAELAMLVDPGHELGVPLESLGFLGLFGLGEEDFDDFARLGGDFALVNLAREAVDADPVARLERLAADRDRFLVVVDIE